MFTALANAVQKTEASAAEPVALIIELPALAEMVCFYRGKNTLT